MAERIYLTIAEAIEMHRQLIEEFGGAHGLRDPGDWRPPFFVRKLGITTALRRMQRL